MDGERRVGVFHTACNTNVFPIIDVNERTMFAAQFISTTFRIASLICCGSPPDPLLLLLLGKISPNCLVMPFVSLEKRIAFQHLCFVFDNTMWADLCLR